MLIGIRNQTPPLISSKQEAYDLRCSDALVLKRLKNAITWRDEAMSYGLERAAGAWARSAFHWAMIALSREQTGFEMK